MLTKDEYIEQFVQRLQTYSKIESKFIAQLYVDLGTIYEYGRTEALKEMVGNTQEWWEQQDGDDEWAYAHGEGK